MREKTEINPAFFCGNELLSGFYFERKLANC